MSTQIEQIRKIVDQWFACKSIPPAQDLMPHLVFLLEQYDLLIKHYNKGNVSGH